MKNLHVKTSACWNEELRVLAAFDIYSYPLFYKNIFYTFLQAKKLCVSYYLMSLMYIYPNLHVLFNGNIIHHNHREELLSKDIHKFFFSLKSQKNKNNIQPVPQKTRVF